MGTKKTSNKVIVETILTTGMTHASAATMFHVSERWIRELMRRYRTAGLTGLEPQSRRPHTTPHATPQATTDRILNTHGYITPQPQKRPRSSWHRFQSDQPNDTWQLDYSHWPLASGRHIPILTILDDHSRFILACQAHEFETTTNLIETFINAGNTYGFPHSTLTDNGAAFTTKLRRTADTRNAFERLLLQMGITQKNGKPYHPQTQGKVERFHQTLQKALTARSPARSISELNSQLTDIIDYYNNHRPHQGINRKTPAHAYNALPKAQPANLPLGDDNRLRRDKVGSAGKVTLRWGGQLNKLYIGRRYQGHDIVLVCLNEHITAVNPHTAEILGEYTLQKGRTYFPNQLTQTGKNEPP